MGGAILALIRPHHWTKNVIVFAPLIFGEQLFDSASLIRAGFAFVAMCLGASAVYVFNDLQDIAADRLHPTKRHRPLVSGRISPASAWIIAAVFALCGSVVALALSPAAGYTLVAYLGINVVYCLAAKHIVILDVMVLGSGYVFRVMLGAFAVQVTPSYWLFLCTLTVSLFLAIGKRRAELVATGVPAAEQRPVLEHYSVAFLDQMIGVVTSATLICYTLYTVDDRTVGAFDTHLLVLTVPFVLYGLFRYLFLLYHRGVGENPTATILLDKAFIINGILWAAACIAVIYAHDTLEQWIRFE